MFGIKSVPDFRRERIEAAVVPGGKSTRMPHEAWIATNPRGMVRVLIAGPEGFERSVGFAPDEDAAVIAELVRASLED
uniref:Uncharacterized protein n=1 Tax=Solibacter usitatus (strain Ellin6076) TaxID=234267 RepID=Q01TP8_SOLUE